MNDRDAFDYRQAFSRNIGWVTEREQLTLRGKRIAIAGLGGVGGSHLLTLTRLGIGAFNLSDFDHFELANFNRQAGAALSTVGENKLEVLAGMARDINSELDIRAYADGIGAGNVQDFLEGVDLYVDGLDFFAVEARRLVFAACAQRGIPAVTAAPLGMGVALLNFIPGRMSFEEYFRLEGRDEDEQLLRFLLGLSPAMLQRGYLADPRTVDFARHRGPSTPMACDLCAGVAATQALKILLGRGKILAAPHGMQFDAYRNRSTRTWRPGGNRNVLQRAGLAIARRQLARMQERQPAPAPVTGGQTTLEKILDQARWAPSGDNNQPWRFEIRGESQLVVHGNDTREHCVYDLQGHASQLSLGGLLETIRIAASVHSLRTDVQRRGNTPDSRPIFDINFVPDEKITPDPLNTVIRLRTVQRRAMRMRALTRRELADLESVMPPGFRIIWLAGPAERFRVTRLTFKSAGLRLNLPEAYAVHRDVIEWGNNDYSEDKMPAGAVGLDPLMLHVTRWVMKSWKRVKFMNLFLGGTLLPRVELELVPGLSCAAHFVIIAERRAREVDDFIAAGGVMQRFWLMAARLGLYIQPEMTPLIFNEYVMDDIKFSSTESMYRRARAIAASFQKLIGREVSAQAVFMGRIGAGDEPRSRSTRLPLSDLLMTGNPVD